jgi:hypothetical protein
MQKAVDQLLTIRTTIDDMANGGGGVGGAEPMLLLLESLGFQQVAFLRQVTCCPHSPSHSPHRCLLLLGLLLAADVVTPTIPSHSKSHAVYYYCCW